MLSEKSWTPIWSPTRASSNCAKWSSMERSICCETSATRAATNSRKCGQYNSELRLASFLVPQYSDALTLRSDLLDPIRERLHEVLQEFAEAVADELAMFIEELVGMADIGFGLLHGRHVKKHERLPEMMIGAEGPDRARRAAGDRTRLAVPDAASIRPGTYIQCILEDGRHRPVIFRRDQQNCISGLDALTERGHWRRRRVGVKILIVKWQLSDFNDFELTRRWRERDQRIRQHPVERRLPQSPNQHAHIHRPIHDHFTVAGDLMFLVKSGLRFSKKAVSASFASSERTCTLNSSFSAFIAALICSRNGCFMSLLLACSPAAGFAANFRAVSVAFASTSLSDTTWVTSPNSAARLASKGVPNKISSAARTLPIRAGTEQLDPNSGTRARLMKGIWNFALSLA